MQQSYQELIEEKLSRLNGKRNADHLTPVKQRNFIPESNFMQSRRKWNALKDDLIQLQTVKKKDKTCKVELPKLWTISSFLKLKVFINNREIPWNPPVLLLTISDLHPLYDLGYFESASKLLNLIGNSNISVYHTQKQNTTARFYRQWANLELIYFRVQEALNVIETGILNRAQPLHELKEHLEFIKSRSLKVDEKLSPLKTPTKRGIDLLEESFSELDVTPTK
eukprot:NODE_113_length_18482_cov_1.630746.p10 type:complete len:224 gc:universal NODE_113_length_18482_cov_1.630746:5267-5938(+)